MTRDGAQPDRSAAWRAGARLWLLPSVALAVIGLLLVAFLRLPVEADRELPVFQRLFVTQDGAGAVASLLSLGLALLGARGLRDRPIGAWVAACAHRAGLVAGVVFALALLGAIHVYRDFPLSMDEYAPRFQAEVFASGHLTGRFPPGAGPFLVTPWFLGQFFLVGADGRVISLYWPGLALLSAPFVKASAAFLLNPLLLAGTFLLLVRLARRWLGDEAAGWSMLFLLASSEAWANGISAYSMSAHLFCSLLFLELLASARPWAAGAVGSLALVLHNPVPHLLVAAPWLGALLSLRPLPWRRIVRLALGYLPLVLLLGFGWVALRREVKSVPVPVGATASSQWIGPTTTRPEPNLLEVVGNPFQLPSSALLLARLLNLIKLGLWNVPGLPFLALLGALWAWRSRREPHRRELLLLAGSAALTLLGYLFVPADQGHGWGYRYFFPAWFALPLLGAAWLTRADATRNDGTELSRRLVFGLIVATIVLSLPLRAVQIRSFIDEQLAQAPPVERLVPPPDRAIVFLDVRRGYYRGDLVRNDPFLRSRVLMLVSRGRDADRALVLRLSPEAELVAALHDDSVWRIPAPAAGGRQ